MTEIPSVAENLTLEKVQEAFARVKDNFTVDGGTVEIITEDRYEDACDIFANYFVPDEPLNKAFGVTWHQEQKEHVLRVLKQNMSVMMVSMENNDVMGFRLNGIMRSTDSIDLSAIQNEQRRDMLTFLIRKDISEGFFDKFGVTEAMHFFNLGVHRNYRRRGLGTKLMEASIALSRELGFKAINGEGSSNYAQRIYEKQGFELLRELKYDEYIYKGEPMSVRTGEHKSTRVYGKQL